MKINGYIAVATWFIASVCQFSAYAQINDSSPPLDLNTALHSQSPIAASEWHLLSITAQHWFKVADAHTVLEGASLERHGDLIFSDSGGGRIMKLTTRKQLTTVSRFKSEGPGGTAIHKDGRIFVALLNKDYTRGRIVAMNADGTHQQDIIPVKDGYVPNDVVFDSKGGFYFTDFRGTSTDPAGGVYHVSSDFRTITPVLRHLSLANGLALSPDNSTLWVTEYGRNQLYRIDLKSPAVVRPLGTAITYRFTGPSPDSMRTESKGNLYVSVMDQGRVLIFASNGVPVGQILLPQRDEGHNLETASLALSPENNSLYIVAGDRNDAEIFRAEGLAPGVRLFSHR